MRGSVRPDAVCGGRRSSSGWPHQVRPCRALGSSYRDTVTQPWRGTPSSDACVRSCARNELASLEWCLPIPLLLRFRGRTGCHLPRCARSCFRCTNGRDPDAGNAPRVDLDGSCVSGDDRSAAPSIMPVLPIVLCLCDRGARKARCNQGNLAGGATNRAMSSLHAGRLRPGTMS